MSIHNLKYSEGELRRNSEMGSDIGNPQQHCHQQSSGLMRYCSAPSSLLTSLVENEELFRNEDHQQHYPSSTNSEMETMFAKLIASPSHC